MYAIESSFKRYNVHQHIRNPVMALNKTAEKQKLNENYKQSLPIRQNLFVAE